MWEVVAGMATLLLGLLKVLAAVFCLSTDWLGGTIFPSIFAGTATGASVFAVAPGVHPSVAIVAGMGGPTTVGRGWSIAMVLIMLFTFNGLLFGLICVDALCGYTGSLITRTPDTY